MSADGPRTTSRTNTRTSLDSADQLLQGGSFEQLRPLGSSYPAGLPCTEKDIHESFWQVTDANTGTGKEAARILYSKNATVWLAVRNDEKGDNAIASISQEHPEFKGALKFLHLDLGDLSTIKAAADELLANEKRLHVLYNNAGVMFPPPGSKTAQGHELQLGTNCLGPGRVGGGSFSFDNLDYKRNVLYAWTYGISEAGNYDHATEFPRRHREDGIISVVYAGISDDVNVEKAGSWNKLVPWGRITIDIRKDVLQGSKPEEEGGTGIAEKFWKWSEEQTRAFV
ncbi:short-chain dehydrogenase [Xylariaceae sp. FL1272]|nr:short-chain dehydrogenase [Xylariaceae sp. FL1272]